MKDCLWAEKLLDDILYESVILLQEVRVPYKSLQVLIRDQMTVILQEVLTEESLSDFKEWIGSINIFSCFNWYRDPKLVE